MEYLDDTIAAISTPPGSGGIGIIRISGPEAFAISKKLFRADFTKKDDEVIEGMKSHTMKHGFIFDPETDKCIDECLLCKMIGPATYTCEDIIEINCHGSFAVLQKVLNLVFRMGARPAMPGEFTKRAFLNGRIDLSEAEAVMDVINSKTEESRKAAVNQLEGQLSKEINRIRQILIDSLGDISVAIDYPEFEMDDMTGSAALEILKKVIIDLEKLGNTFNRGRLIREGLHVVIAGKPNAGKSSLLNRISGHNRAIVTDIPGTTRDTIEEFIEIDGLPVILTDTAGLRETEDTVEKIGVLRAQSEVDRADLVLYVIDGNEENVDFDYIREINKEKLYIVINKIDIAQKNNIEKIKEKLNDLKIIEISLINDEGVDRIFEAIKCYFMKAGSVDGENIVTNARHKLLIDNSVTALKRGIENYTAGMPLDCVTYDILQCAGFLGEITGQNVSEDVIENIFRRFCIGK